MRNLILSALLLASVFQTAKAEQSGDWTYSVENNQATITGYTGAGGAVTLPSSVNGIIVTAIYNYVFQGSTSLTSINIPNSVTTIGALAFRECTSLTSITIPNSVTSIGVFAFYFSGLTSITLGNSVANIGEGAFYGCTGLTSITIPNSVTSIRDSAFAGCTSLTTITIPNSVTSIGHHAFQGCASLASIIIPNSVTSIGAYAFSGCTGLTSIIIPNGVTSIGEYAFYYCTGLTSITIPDSVTSIGRSAFAGCSSVYLPARFETTYQDFGLTSAQVIFYDPSNLAPIYLAGQQSVIANPNTHNLYTTSQIQNMAVGDLVLTRTNGSNLVLNYDIEQSEDLQTWTTYQGYALPLTNLPTNKAFVRIKAK